jgi:hypothetical protein
VAAVPCFTRKGKEQLFGNSLDSFKMIDNASSRFLAVSGDDSQGKGLVLTGKGRRLKKIITTI